jgi:DNA-binding response OmpR family regulator
MSDSNQLSILLCEDDPNLGRLLSDYLKAKGFETTWAKDGVEGLKEFHRNAFDFIILDVMMPRKDGYQVAEEIRRENKHLPICKNPSHFKAKRRPPRRRGESG